MFSRVIFVGLTACATASPSSFGDSGNGGDAQRTGDAHRDAPTSGCSFTGALATWDLSGQTGSEASVVAATMANGVTAGQVTRSSAVTSASGAGSINGSNWPSGATLDVTKYYALTIAPPAGCSIKLSTISIDAKSSGTGPATAVLATSADSFVMTTSVSTSAASSPTLTVTSASSLEIRIFGYSASATAGTLRIQNTLAVNGQIL